MARRPPLSAPPLPKKALPVVATVASKAHALRPPSRQNARAVTIWVPPEAKAQLRAMVFEMNIPEQRLGEEALNDLFAKYRRHRIAVLPRKER